jgi:ankyrin repeat protein
LKQFILLFIAFCFLFSGCANESVPSTRDREFVPTTQLLPQEAEMLEAAGKGNTARVQELLERGVNVNMRGADGNTPIMEATYGGHLDVIKLLLDHGADLSAKKRDGATAPTLTGNKDVLALFKNVAALVTAAAGGDVNTVKALLDSGTPVNGLDQAGESALHAACWSGKTEVVKLLLNRGADPEIKKADGASPVNLATGQKHDDIVVLLNEAIAKKAKSPAANRSGTPTPSRGK